MSELINVCHEVRCPYSRKSGCDRYTVSSHCHLAYSAPGTVRQGIRIRASQYWLYADDSYDRVETEQMQNAFLSRPSEIRSAERQVELQDKPYEVSWK
jgi:hypothetical protein